MTWKYFEPKFEYEVEFNDLSWPWAGHKFFAYDLVSNLKPKKIVELGTHYGTSLWSFSQAVKDQQIDTELFAVDTWEGEEHAGFYGEEVFEKVKKIKEKFYSGLKINLLRKTFDEALNDFENESIDILHIDGSHTYEAVKNDFEAWLPKVKKGGMVLFHDVKVSENDFGVYHLWRELKEKYSTIEFHQSFGLGALFLDKNIGKEIEKKEEEWQMHYSYLHETKRGQNIQEKEQEIQRKDIAIQIKEQEIDQRNKELRQMKSSLFWKARLFYLATKSTLPFYFFELVEKAWKVFRREGFLGFLKYSYKFILYGRSYFKKSFNYIEDYHFWIEKNEKIKTKTILAEISKFKNDQKISFL